MSQTLVIIPAYNEEKSIGALVNEIRFTAPKVDIIVINDASNDNTAEICKELKVSVINLPNNLGIGGAMQTGYKYALANNYDIAIQCDGDGQHDPSYLSLLIDEIEKGQAHLVIGSRFINNTGFQSTFIRRLGIRFFNFLIHTLTRKNFTDPTSGFRACQRDVIKLFAKSYPRDYPEPETIATLTRYGLTIKELPVIMRSREGGVSSINLFKSIYYMFKVTAAIVIGSSKPNKVISTLMRQV